MLTRVLGASALGLLGAVIALVGAGAHRAAGYLGVTLALLLIVAAGVFAKVWHAWAGWITFALCWAIGTLGLAQYGPGDSQLIAGDLKGELWVYGGAALMAVVAVIPRRLWVGRDVEA